MTTKPRKTPPRDDFYMGMALMACEKSKDPSTQISAFIVSSTGKPLGWGYNGPPSEIDDDKMDWSRPHKYHLIIHAEDNAIKHSSKDLQGATLYVTGRPCKHCMLDIISNKISRVVFFPLEKFVDKGSMLNNEADVALINEMAKKGRVTLEEFKGNVNWVRDRQQTLFNMGVFGNAT